MPTEHEFKYALSLNLAKDYPEDQLKVVCADYKTIEQGVICQGPGMYLRVRRAINSKGITDWTMTFKLKDAERTIEIENPLDSRDGEDLWGRCFWKLRKDRYIYEQDGIKWEIDFFKDADEGYYFVVAEVELPEKAPRPKKIPPFIKKYLLFEVPLTDDRFSE